MPRTPRAIALALTLGGALAVAACSSPTATTNGPAGTDGPAATAPADPGGATEQPAAGDACSYLSADAVGAIVGAIPVEVAERPGRGDCDYFLTAARDEKVNIGVTTGPDAAGIFENTKALGEPQSVPVGDEAYAIVNESIGTVVVARKGASVIVIQVAAGTDAGLQLTQATALAEAVVAGL